MPDENSRQQGEQIQVLGRGARRMKAAGKVLVGAGCVVCSVFQENIKTSLKQTGKTRTAFCTANSLEERSRNILI